LACATGSAPTISLRSTTFSRGEVTAQRRIIDRTQERFDLWPERLTGDTGYGWAENLAWLAHEPGIEPHIPVFDKSQRTDGTFSRGDFAYDRKRDCYVCPAGKERTPAAAKKLPNAAPVRR
jgi:hypothetical protein